MNPDREPNQRPTPRESFLGAAGGMLLIYLLLNACGVDFDSNHIEGGGLTR